MAQHIRVVQYCPEWDEKYRREAEHIARILGQELVEMHHIGSTAVKGLSAKPIIDLMPVVRRIQAIDAYNEEFENLGYECMGEFGIPGRRYFRKGGDERSHQIHVFEEGNQKDITRHLAVRDYLRTHDAMRRQYGVLKKELARQYPENIEAYCEGKDSFVKEMERRALLWYRKQQRGR